MPLAASATGTGIRSRILALQLLTIACDKHAAGYSSQKSFYVGHLSVSEALSTLRLHCGEPVRFRLLVGMMNSGGGTGELQYHGLKFVNTFLDSAENIQNRLYLQAELYQAGFDPTNMNKVNMTENNNILSSMKQSDLSLSFPLPFAYRPFHQIRNGSISYALK